MDHACASNKNYDVTEVAYTKENIKDFFLKSYFGKCFCLFPKRGKINDWN